MKCTDCQRLLIDGPAERLPELRIHELEEHLEGCPECRTFRDQLRGWRRELDQCRFPRLPGELDRLTRRRSLDELRRTAPAKAGGFRRIRKSVPPPVYAALLVLMVTTLILISPLVGGLSFESPLSAGEIMAVTLILQNTVMLLFSPLLIKKYGFDPVTPFTERKNG